MKRLAFLVLAGLLACGRSHEPAGGQALRLATTTSVKDSGLLDVLLPAFQKKTGYRVEVSSVGSGKAIELLAGGKADVAITHAPEEEEAAVRTGAVAARLPFMHNEFVIVGPKGSEAVVAGAASVTEAMQRIAASGKKFVSRADGSGTFQREQLLWKTAGLATDAGFIVQAKAGMGATLERASKDGGFTLTDRATLLAKRKDLELVIVFQGDPLLVNHYAVLLPAARDGVNAQGAKALADFVRSDEGQAVIGAYGVKQVGESLFTPE